MEQENHADKEKQVIVDRTVIISTAAIDSAATPARDRIAGTDCNV
jgi:hypothetical protein